jgi:hypothetical protein
LDELNFIFLAIFPSSWQYVVVLTYHAPVLRKQGGTQQRREICSRQEFTSMVPVLNMYFFTIDL